MKARKATKPRELTGAAWFRHTIHCTESWAPTLARQFREVMEGLMRKHGYTSYWAALAALLAEADVESRT